MAMMLTWREGQKSDDLLQQTRPVQRAGEQDQSVQFGTGTGVYTSNC